MSEVARRTKHVDAMPKLSPTRDSTIVSDHMKAFTTASQADGCSVETQSCDPRIKYKQWKSPQYDKHKDCLSPQAMAALEPDEIRKMVTQHISLFEAARQKADHECREREKRLFHSLKGILC